MDYVMVVGLVYETVDLMVTMKGCWWAVSLAYTTVDVMVRMTGCLTAQFFRLVYKTVDAMVKMTEGL